MTRAFHVQIIKPAHYDDEGYVIQWWKASIQSNSLASLYAIVQDAADRQVLSADVTLTSNGWDECNTVISEDRIAKRIPSAGAGVVFLVGVQTNQFASRPGYGARFRAVALMSPSGLHVFGFLTCCLSFHGTCRKQSISRHHPVCRRSRRSHRWPAPRCVREQAAPHLQFPGRSAGPAGCRRSLPAARTAAALLAAHRLFRRRSRLSVSVQLLHHHRRARPQVTIPNR